MNATMAEEEDAVATIPEMLRFRSRRDGERQTFRFYDRHGFVSQMAPPELYTLAGRFAHLLRGWGFQTGDVIANALPNSPERVVCDFGIVMTGCVQVNCQVLEKDGSDFWHTANISHCSGVIVSTRPDNSSHKVLSQFFPSDKTNEASSLSSSTNKTNIISTNVVHDVTIQQAPTIRKIILCHRKSLVTTPEDNQNKEENVKPTEQSERLKSQKQQQVNGSQYPSFLEALKSLDGEKEFYEASCDPSDLAVLLSTSGTTGFNKLVPRSHKDILSLARGSGKQGREILTYNDRPLGWIGGYPLDFLGSGACRVTQDTFDNQNTRTPRELWDVVSLAKCQGVSLMLPEVIRLVEEFEPNPPEHKVWFISTGGQAIRKEVSKAIGLLSHGLVVSYGFSEGGVVTVGIIMAGKEATPEVEDFYCGTVFKDDVNIKIVDPEGVTMDPGQIGEIYVKCDLIPKSHYNKMDDVSTLPQPKLHTDDGWYKTGDRGKLLADGKLYCYGRDGDLASVDGVIVYFSWLESILNKCPDVQNSSVVAIDDVDHNKGDVLFVGFVERKRKLKSDESESSTAEEEEEEELKHFFEEQLVDTEYKGKLSLSYICILDTLPLTPTGKVNRRMLKEMALEKVNGKVG